MNTTRNFERNTNAPDGIHDAIEFNEWKNPEFWMKERARRALMEDVAPILIVLATLVAFAVIGYVEGCL